MEWILNQSLRQHGLTIILAGLAVIVLILRQWPVDVKKLRQSRNRMGHIAMWFLAAAILAWLMLYVVFLLGADRYLPMPV